MSCPCPHTHPLPSLGPDRSQSCAKAGGCLRCPPAFIQPQGALDPSGSPSSAQGWLVALTCVPGPGVALLGLAQPLLVPGVCKVDNQHQLDEDEEEGAHDATVEPDWVGRGE